MDTREALQKIESAPPAVPSVGQMLQAVIEKGVTQENVAAIEKLVGLYERMEDRKAGMSASRALRELQAAAKAIAGTRAVPDRNGQVRYKYVPYEDLMKQAQPLLTQYGFSVRFSQRMEADRETVICTLTHDDGHSFVNEFTVRIGSGPPGATSTQADSSAGTVAQREAFCDALNIVRARDDDAALIGKTITEEQACELHRRVLETNSNMGAFLKFCGVETARPCPEDFGRIPLGKYDAADEMLSRKEKAGR